MGGTSGVGGVCCRVVGGVGVAHQEDDGEGRVRDVPPDRGVELIPTVDILWRPRGRRRPSLGTAKRVLCICGEEVVEVFGCDLMPDGWPEYPQCVIDVLCVAPQSVFPTGMQEDTTQIFRTCSYFVSSIYTVVFRVLRWIFHDS